MRNHQMLLRLSSPVLLLVGALGIGSAQGYPNGPLIHVSDLAPACAGCHSSMSADQVRNLPPDFAAKQVVGGKHYQAILSGAGAYKDLSQADREKLVEDLKLLDANSTVSLSAPTGGWSWGLPRSSVPTGPSRPSGWTRAPRGSRRT